MILNPEHFTVWPTSGLDIINVQSLVSLGEKWGVTILRKHVLQLENLFLGAIFILNWITEIVPIEIEGSGIDLKL